ncbi:hypothetical protein NL108_018255 [Boleophthalmus pectinirostris]|nr:hypothetical protein NL108_018255 [Boleophthalmus pectinirostris]
MFYVMSDFSLMFWRNDFTFTQSLLYVCVHTLGHSKSLKIYSVVAAKIFQAKEQILQKIKAEDCDDPENCDLVIVFCPIQTRAAADVATAMKTIPEKAKEKNVILVTMFHTDDDKYPVPPTDWKYENNVVLRVNVLYHETVGGLLDCSCNNEAIEKIKLKQQKNLSKTGSRCSIG